MTRLPNTVWTLLVLMVWTATAVTGQEEDFGVIVRQFAKARHKLANELSTELALPLPAGVPEFFNAAEKGDARVVSNLFQQLKMPGQYGPAIPELRNELWAPIHETLGIYEVWDQWQRNSELLKGLAEPVLAAMPKGSVYFGGTDSGRFVITTVNAVRKPPPVFCLTQNALADTMYLAHLRRVYGKRLWLPDELDAQHAFQEFVAQWQAGQTPRAGGVTIVNGRVTVTGVEAVMAINAILCRMIFEHNKAAHEFFIEESYIIDWMYPYLEPQGLIMKLNQEPLRELSAEVIAKDQAFWNDTIATLRKQPGFTDNSEARKAFSKLRTAIAGIYVSRQLYEDAERAFQQALELCPESPEANHRLAQMWEARGQPERALELFRAFVGRMPGTMDQRTANYLKTLEAKRSLTAAERRTLTLTIQQLGAEEATVRRTAKQEITTFGARALPLLREHTNAQDPEVRLSVQELIRELGARNEGGASN